MSPSTWMDDLQGSKMAQAEAPMRTALRIAASKIPDSGSDATTKCLTPLEVARARRKAIRDEMNAMLRRQGLDC
jgi:hypothetical protein